jgi:hypothetical protein
MLNLITKKEVPAYCGNCAHKVVCGIQDTIVGQDEDVKEFNDTNKTRLQTVSSINYNCRYKLKEA